MSSSIEQFLQNTGGITPPKEPQGPAPGDSELGRWYTDADTTSRLDTAVGLGDPKQADQAARVLRLQGKTGLPQDLIEHNLDEVEKQARRADFDPEKFKQQSPIVAKWLAEDPKHVILAAPDLTKLSYLERQIQNVKNQFEQGKATTELWTIGEAAMKGTVTPAQRARQAELESGIMTKQPGDLGITGFFEGVPGAIANQVPIFLNTLEGKMEYGAKGAAHGAAIGAIAGAVAGAPEAGVGALPGAMAGAAAGSAAMGAAGYHWGAAIAAGRMEAALAYLEYEKVRDKDGHPLDRDTMLGAAAITGVLNGALEMVGFESVAKTVPGLRMLEKTELQRALKTQTVSGAIRRLAKGVGEAMVTEGATEFMQDVVKNGAEEIATMIQDGSIKTASPTQILARIFSEQHMQEAIQDAKAGAQAGGGMALAGGTASAISDVNRARTAKTTQNFYTALSQATTDSQIMDKLPSKMQEVVSHLTQDGPVQNIYAPIETWNEYWQSKNLDPVQAAREVTGSDGPYDEAVRTGGDLVIPTERYAMTIAPTEHNTFFQNEIRLDPMAMNQREASELGKTMAEEEQRRAEAQKTEDTSPQIGEKILEQLTNAGFDEQTAKNYSSLWQQTFKTLGERTGLDPVKLFERYNVSVAQVDEVTRNTTNAWVEQYQSSLSEEDRAFLQTPEGQSELAKRLLATPEDRASLWRVVDREMARAEQRQSEAEQRVKGIMDKAAQQTYEQSQRPEDRNAYQQSIADLWQEQGRNGRLSLLANWARLYPEKQFLPGFADMQIEDLPEHVQQQIGMERVRQVVALNQLLHPPKELPPGDNYGFWQSQSPVPTPQGVHMAWPTPEGMHFKAEALISEKMPRLATLDDIRGILKGLKEEERKWSGIDEMLKSFEENFPKDEKLEKDYVLSHLMANRLQIVELVQQGEIDEDAITDLAHEMLYQDAALEVQSDWAIEEVDNDLFEKPMWQARPLHDVPDQFKDPTLGGHFSRTEATNAAIQYVQDKAIQKNDMLDEYMLRAEDELRRRNVNGEGGGAYAGYTLPGGENYTETLFTVPQVPGKYRSSHWRDINVFAHVRTNERVIEGRRVLFIEEIQSDWHEEGREEGYKTEIKKSVQKIEGRFLTRDGDYWILWHPTPPGAVNTTSHTIWGSGKTEEEVISKAIAAGEITREQAAALPFVDDEREVVGGFKEPGVPDAPFKSTWHEFVLKRMMRIAAEDGFDSIALATGAHQNYRYSLEKVIDEIMWFPETQELHGIKEGRSRFMEAVSKEELPKYIGKELTEKLLATPRANEIAPHQLRGENLRIGGSGMRGFYDDIIPRFLNKFTKKYGAKVQDVDMQIGAAEVGMLQQGIAREAADFIPIPSSMGQQEAESYWGGSKGYYKPITTTVHELQLTPELKKAALNNEFSLYQMTGAHQRALEQITAYKAELIAESRNEVQRLGEPFSQTSALQRIMIKLEKAVKAHDQLKAVKLIKDIHDENPYIVMNALQDVANWANAFQQGEGQPRGRIRFSDEGINIELLKSADLSTFLHETGHFYMHVMQDLAGSNESVAQDLKTIHNWLGVKEGEAPTRDQHEIFARGFEAYLMEGRAPVASLRAAFSRFRAWLVTIYKSFQSLNVTLTPEVKNVFDRLVATQDEITAAEREVHAEPLFADPEAAGMSKQQAEDYRLAIAQARAAAEEELTKKLTNEVRREQNRQYQQQRDRTRYDVAQQVNQDRVQLALAALSRGTMPDGTPLPEHLQNLKLDRQAILDMYGGDAGVLKSLPRPYLYSKEGGIHPDRAAELFGFSSGRQLLQALPGPGQESPMQRIERLTDEKMKAEHGDLFTDGRLPAEALKAVHNIDRAQLMRKELQHLARNDLPTLKGLLRKIQRRVPTIESVRLEAESIIDSKRVRDILPSQYQHAETKAAKAALEALLKGDIELAFDEKQRELFNHELFRAASNARDNVDRVVDFMGKFNVSNKREQLKKAGGSYLAQIDAIRDRFDFRRSVTNKELANRESLINFVNEHASQGLPISVPTSVLNEAYRQHYKNMTFRELQDLRDVVKQIDHLARLKNELLQLQRQRSFEATKSNIVSSIAANHSLKGEPLDLNPNFGKRFAAGMKRLIASHTKMEFLFEWLDGNKDNGAVWTELFKPFADAEGAEETMMRAASTELRNIFNAYTKEERAKWFFDKIHLDGFDTSFTKSNLLTVALNWGNQYNREALMEGYHWNEAQVQRLLDTLTAKDWGVVQRIWDYLDSFWPAIAKQEADFSGLPPEKVQADEVITKHGTFRGGYYPIVFDNKLSWRQATLDAKRETQELFGGRWSRAMTRHGHTEERTNTGGKPLVLTLSGLTEHVTNVVHDLTHRRAVVDVNRLTQDHDVRVAIEKSVGREMYKQIHPWLVNIARNQRQDYVNPIESIFSRARSGATVVSMGWKLTTAFTQFLSYTNTIKEVGVKYASQGVADVYSKPWKLNDSWKFITERSEFMHSRLSNWDRDVHDALQRMNVSGTTTGPMSVFTPYTTELRDSWFSLVGWMDMGASMPTWMGAYRKAMDGAVDNIDKGDEHGAIDYADKIVRQTQGVGAPKDLAMVQRGTEMFKLFTNFYSYWNVLFNQFAKTQHQFTIDKSIPKLVGALTMLWFLPAALQDALVGRTPNPDDDPEEWIKWLLGAEIRYPFNSVILLRDIVNSISSQFDYAPSPALDAFAQLVKAGKGIRDLASGARDELTRAQVRSIVLTTGYFAKLPARQLWLTLQYFHDWWTGDLSEDFNPWHALVTGEPKE